MTLATAAGVASVTQIKRGLQALLLGEVFGDALTELQIAFADGLPVVPLKSVSRAERKTLPAEMPYAEILAVQSVPLGAGALSSQSREHVIAIRFYVAGDDEELITDHVERYVLAARRMLSLDPGDEMRLFPFLGGTADPGDEDYDPIVGVKDTEATLVKAGTLELVVRTVN